MISFAVGYGGGSVGVSCEVVEFCDSIVRALWHSALLRQLGLVMGEWRPSARSSKVSI